MIPKAFVYASIAWPNAATPEFLRSQALERAFSLAFLLAPPSKETSLCGCHLDVA